MTEYGFPPAEQYLELARETADFVCNQQELRSENNGFCSEISKSLASLRNPKADGFRLKANLETIIDDKIHNVRIGGLVQFAADELVCQSYWIELFGCSGSPLNNKIFYRVHFDVAVPSQEKNAEKHPVYHIQLGGKAANAEYFDKDMKHWSSPRIPYIPLSLAMFFEIVFREFGTGYIAERMYKEKDKGWCAILNKNEEVMIPAFKGKLVEYKHLTLSTVYYDGI